MTARPDIAGFGFSVGDIALDFSDLDETLGRIEDAGASHCELNLGRYELVIDGRVLTDRVRAVKNICATRSLRYTAHGALAVNFMDTPNLDLHRRVFRATLEAAAELEASVLVHHPGIVAAASPETIDPLHAQERDALAELAELAKRLGPRIAVETIFVETSDRYTADPFRLAQEIEAVRHPQVVGTLDVSHSFIQTGSLGLDFRAALRRFAQVTNHVHMHDSFGRPTTVKGHSASEDMAFGMGDLHLPPGWGAIPWDEIFAELSFQEGTVVIVEMRPRHRPMMRDAADYMRRLIQPGQKEPKQAPTKVACTQT